MSDGGGLYLLIKLDVANIGALIIRVQSSRKEIPWLLGIMAEKNCRAGQFFYTGDF
jgi:hypothetical protein